jgi:ATP-dependent DNA helicase RecG
VNAAVSDASGLDAPVARRDAAAERVPLRFAANEPLKRAELTAVRTRLPRPSRLAVPLDVPSKRIGKALATLGIETVGELLSHLPRQIRASCTIEALKLGEQATIAVEVQRISRRNTRKRVRGRPLTLVEARVSDGTGTVTATFFNQPWLVERYAPGTRLVLHGALRDRRGFAVTHHAPAPDAAVGVKQAPGPGAPAGGPADVPELAGFDAEAGGEESGPQARGPARRAVAHYRASDGISSTQILALVERYRHALADVVEPLPLRLLAAERLPDRASALAAMHFAADEDELERGRQRLAFEELLLSQLALRRRRALAARVDAHALGAPGELTASWLARSLPFALTDDQRQAIGEIDGDLGSTEPMQRLLMGEVGSGKTVVALYAMLRAVENGLQAALMAPTETLAEQHFATLQKLAPDGLVSAALLTGSTPARQRADVLGKLGNGQLSLLVGTHALIEDDVRFGRLGVAVVDEQHRFGVRQRAALSGREPAPHVLHMTATPIPRTLALTSFGDLDFTRLTQLPAGRKPIATHVAETEAERARAYERLREELRAGRQAYIVCPLVSESGQLEGRAATAEYERLRRTELADFSVALLHGQMRPREKQAAIAGFASREADVLVATTVIEVGIDVPNATAMLIEDAERYGVAQLHQLRGRVGRGEHASLCLLFGAKSSRRLRALVEHADGFRLAEIDLELREAGELEDGGDRGSPRQSGESFRIARIPGDGALLESAVRAAEQLLAADPELELPEHALLAEALRPVPA